MAKENIDSLFEPIEFTLEGKDYKIEKIDPDLIARVTVIDTKTDGITGITKQFSLLTGIAEEEARRIDIRKIKRAIEIVMEAIAPKDDVKNASREEAK